MAAQHRVRAPGPQGLRQDPVHRRDPEPHRDPAAVLRAVPPEGRSRPSGATRRGCRPSSSRCSRSPDYNGNAMLEFHSYHFGDPKYTVEECHDRGMTFAIPLKVTLRLKVIDNDKEDEDPDRARGARAGGVSRRAAAHDREGHLHHQRHRAGRGLAAPALRGRVLRRRQGQDGRLGQAAVLGPRDPLPRLVGGVRVRRQRHPLRPGRPAAQDARHRVPARVLVPREGRDPLRRGDPRPVLRDGGGARPSRTGWPGSSSPPRSTTGPARRRTSRRPARQGSARPGGQDRSTRRSSRSWSRPASPRSRSRRSRWSGRRTGGGWSTRRPARCWSRRTRRSPPRSSPRSWGARWRPSSCSRSCRARRTARSTRRCRATTSRIRTRPWSRSTGACARAIRPPSSRPARSSAACSSTRAATTWPASAAS